MLQKGSDMYQNISYMDDVSQFVLYFSWTICHRFILDDLSLVTI